jgi:hypothetical protein
LEGILLSKPEIMAPITQTTAFFALQYRCSSKKSLPKRPPPLVNDDGVTFVCRSWKTYFSLLATIAPSVQQYPIKTDSFMSLSSEETATDWADEVPAELVQGAKSFSFDTTVLKSRKKKSQKKNVSWSNMV